MKRAIFYNAHNKTVFFLVFFFIAMLELAVAFSPGDSTEKPLRRLNFLVSPKQKKFDPAPFSFHLQVRIKRLFHRGDIYVIIARSSEEMAEKICGILKEKNAMIGSIWFDSHGLYKRRRSTFKIGEEEFNYKSIRDSALTGHLKKLTPFCDTKTKAGIGSCYGGATYTLPAIEHLPAQRMNGDSLMIGLSDLLGNAIVFACESFVMTKPGILSSRYAFYGLPGKKKFKDPLYASVWEKLGDWNCYSGETEKFGPPVTVTLGRDGDIQVKEKKYMALEKNIKKLSRKMQSLKSGNYNIAKFYQ